VASLNEVVAVLEIVVTNVVRPSGGRCSGSIRDPGRRRIAQILSPQDDIAGRLVRVLAAAKVKLIDCFLQ